MSTISAMKGELHARLWNAQERWFALKEVRATKHELKLRGLASARTCSTALVVWSSPSSPHNAPVRVSMTTVFEGVGRFPDHGR